jgi:hypothetical protein
MTSVDDRLRAGLKHEIPAQPQVHALCDRVIERAHRRRARRRLTLAAAAAAVLAVAGAAAARPWADDDIGHSPPASQHHEIVIPSPQSTTQKLEGRWEIRSAVTRSRLADTLKAAGLGQWVDEVRAELPQDQKWSIRMQDGYLIAEFADNGVFELLDRRLAQLEGHRMVLEFDDGTPGESVYRWQRSGDMLRFTLVRTTDPDRDRIPGEVYQRALYTTVPFHRVR